MSATGLFLGRLGNVFANANGKHYSLKDYEAITFVAYLDAGTQTITLKQSQAGANEAALNAIDLVHKAPGTGGAHTEVTQTASDSFDLSTDATNDQVAVTVRGRQLDDGFDSVEATVDSGIVFAILHDLNVQSDPTSLTDPTVA